MKEINLIVYGIPIAQGSKRAFFKKGMKHAVLTEDSSKVKPWRQEIAVGALEQMRKLKLPAAMDDAAFDVDCTFYFTRPKSLKKHIAHKRTKPDVDKLARAVMDALTGTVYKDDGQVVNLHSHKRFDNIPRAEIRVRLLIDEPLFQR